MGLYLRTIYKLGVFYPKNLKYDSTMGIYQMNRDCYLKFRGDKNVFFPMGTGKGHVLTTDSKKKNITTGLKIVIELLARIIPLKISSTSFDFYTPQYLT